MSKLLKNLLLALGLAVLLLFAYMQFIRDNSDMLSGGSIAPEVELKTQQLRSTINLIESYDVSGKIFSDRRFMSLNDFKTPLGEEQFGRVNPFAPVK